MSFNIRLLLFIFLLNPVNVLAKKAWQSGPTQIPLVELYSSEGCSSCPPAEKWMANLEKNKNVFKDFTPINFHVDYWNRLGWIDPFSQKKFTKRQRQYANSWNARTVYTPAFVVNGVNKRHRGKQSFLSGKGTGGFLKAQLKDKNKLQISYDQPGEYDVYIAIIQNDLVSKVTAGENDGRTLKHNFVAKSLEKLSMKKNTAVFSLPKNKDSGFALWVTRKNSLTPLQSLGGYW